jgi:hypothetical protein
MILYSCAGGALLLRRFFPDLGAFPFEFSCAGIGPVDGPQ